MLRIFIVRHGETEWSLSGQHTSVTDIALTARGEAMARDTGRFLEQVSFAHVFSSPRQRARQTASLAGFEGKTEIEDNLAEWNYGDYEGRRTVDIRQERPDWTLFRDGCPDGETPEQVSGRADALVAKLATMEGNVALFSHGHFSCVFAARWIGLPVIEAQHLSLDPAALGILSYGAHQSGVRILSLWNASPAILQGKL